MIKDLEYTIDELELRASLHLAAQNVVGTKLPPDYFAMVWAIKYLKEYRTLLAVNREPTVLIDDHPTWRCCCNTLEIDEKCPICQEGYED